MDRFADQVIEPILEEEKEEEARDGDDQAAEGGEESDGDVTGERGGFSAAGLGEGGEGADHADDGAEQAEHGGDLREHAEITDPFLIGFDFDGGEVCHGIFDLFDTEFFVIGGVEVGKGEGHHATKEGGAAGGDFDGAANAALLHEFGELGDESRGCEFAFCQGDDAENAEADGPDRAEAEGEHPDAAVEDPFLEGGFGHGRFLGEGRLSGGGDGTEGEQGDRDGDGGETGSAMTEGRGCESRRHDGEGDSASERKARSLGMVSRVG